MVTLRCSYARCGSIYQACLGRDDATIKNAFNKAELVTLKSGAQEKVDTMADLLCSFKALNIPIDESTLDEFVHVHDENSE